MRPSGAVPLVCVEERGLFFGSRLFLVLCSTPVSSLWQLAAQLFAVKLIKDESKMCRQHRFGSLGWPQHQPGSQWTAKLFHASTNTFIHGSNELKGGKKKNQRKNSGQFFAFFFRFDFSSFLFSKVKPGFIFENVFFGCRHRFLSKL